MGEVFLARQRGLGQFERLVVLKRLRRDLTLDERFETLFLEEARISARLSHPNVVQVYEFGHIDDSYFLTLEYVRGANLNTIKRRLSRARRWFPLDALLEIMVQACAGLSYVHRLEDFDGQPLQIVHRDISPSNIMTSREGQVKLLDFGVAHARGAIDPDRRVRGKHSYLSPEQYRRESLDERSDLFSLGVVFWEMLTGSRLFRRATPEETIAAMLHDPVPAPSTVRGDVPDPLDHIVLKLLERDRNRRYRTAEELAQALETLASALALPIGHRALLRFMSTVGENDGKNADGEVETGGPSLGDSAMSGSIASASVADKTIDVQPAHLGLEPDPPETLVPSQPRQASGPTHAMLLVDDEADNLDALVRTFRNGRFFLFSAADPYAALQILAEHPIDIVITDQRMPGMTGLELVQKAQQLRPGLLKVLASAFVDTTILLGAINTGMVHRFIVKPWQPDDVRATIDALISSRPASLAAVERQVKQHAAQLGLGGVDPSIITNIPTQTRIRRRRLRPEIVRALGYTKQFSLLMLGAQPAEQTETLVAWIQTRIAMSDMAFPVAPGKLAVVLLGAAVDDSQALAVRLQKEAVQPGAPLEGGQLHYGLAAMPTDTEEVDELIMLADMALFHARSNRAEANE
jgi:serine/threonine-protein kinase